MSYHCAERIAVLLDQWASWLLLDDAARNRASVRFTHLPRVESLKPRCPFVPNQARAMNAALMAIDTTHAEAIAIYHLSPLRYADKAAALGLSKSTMHSRLVAAHMALVDAYEAERSRTSKTRRDVVLGLDV